ncbi:MAG: endo-beta-N-acetylglucosaminidase family protein [Streptococcaceae bacterium]|nr:endo-beta-N-acetylglucosaminidase family protein [Streptococcaceae bacterium]
MNSIPSTRLFNKKNALVLALLTLLIFVGSLFLPPFILKAHAATEGIPKTVMYVEVNNNDFNNVGKYTLESTTKPAFDIGIIFAANINYDTTSKKPYLFLNERVTQTLNEYETQIRPVQARGTKVLLSILGNHQGAGFANFTTYESADAFAAEIEQVVNKYHLDGVDFDDEYAEYGKNGTAQPNNSSFIWLLQALRSRLGTDKLITLYNIGPSAYNSATNPLMSELVNYSWNPYYGSWQPPQIVGMDASRLGAAAVEVGVNQSTAIQLANRTKTEKYGIYLMYNLSGTNSASYISAVTQELYGRKTLYSSTIPVP